MRFDNKTANIRYERFAYSSHIVGGVVTLLVCTGQLEKMVA